MLTPQLIDSMNKATGNNVPLNAGQPNYTPSRADQILALGKANTPTSDDTSQPGTFNTGVVQPTKQIGETLSDYLQRVDKGFIGSGGTAEQFTNQIEKDASPVVNNTPQTNIPLEGVKLATNALGTGAKAIGNTIGNVVQPALDITSEGLVKNDGQQGGVVDTLANMGGDIKTTLGKLSQTPEFKALAKQAENHPEIARQLENLFNVSTLLVGEGIAKGAYNLTKDEALPALSNLVDKGLATVGEKVATGVNITADLASKGGDIAINSKNAVKGLPEKVSESIPQIVKEPFIPALTPDEAAGKIAQGKIEDVPVIKQAIKDLPKTDNIKTNSDLAKAIREEIKNTSKQVDSEFAKDTSGGHSIKSYEQTVGTGKNAVRVNYVRQALDDLGAYFEKTNDAKGSSYLKSLLNKEKINGLTYKDINDLARLHGQKLTGFNANGELATGLSKQAAENTRMGLKETARKGLGSDEAKQLDAKLSNLYDALPIVEKNAEAVNKLTQSTSKQGVVPKIINKGIDIAAGPLKYAAKKAGIGVEDSGKLNAKELEAQLQKNIKTIKHG